MALRECGGPLPGGSRGRLTVQLLHPVGNARCFTRSLFCKKGMGLIYFKRYGLSSQRISSGAFLVLLR